MLLTTVHVTIQSSFKCRYFNNVIRTYVPMQICIIVKARTSNKDNSLPSYMYKAIFASLVYGDSQHSSRLQGHAVFKSTLPGAQLMYCIWWACTRENRLPSQEDWMYAWNSFPFLFLVIWRKWIKFAAGVEYSCAVCWHNHWKSIILDL